jgi:hypothetical protein
MRMRLGNLVARSARALAGCVVLATCAAMTSGCERQPPPVTPPAARPAPPPATAARRDPEYVSPPPVKPDYRFAEDLRDEYPEIVGFLRQFMETSLAGDYAGYRKLVSRQCDPENRERFAAILNAIRVLHVDAIEPVAVPELPGEVYRVLTRIELKPEARVRLRRQTDRVAILVLREDGAWRMMPAPGELQPHELPATATAPAATTSAPSYPWDQDGDS